MGEGEIDGITAPFPLSLSSFSIPCDVSRIFTIKKARKNRSILYQKSTFAGFPFESSILPTKVLSVDNGAPNGVNYFLPTTPLCKSRLL